MRFVKAKENEDGFKLQYKATYRMSFELLLDFMQIFLNDVVDNVFLIEKEILAGSKPQPIENVIKTPLYCIEDFKKECGSISITGISKTLNSKLKLVAYNQLDIVYLYVFSNQKIIDDIKNNNRTLDKYMDSIELGMTSRISQRNAINLFGKCICFENKEDMKRFENLCNELGATPFPQK